MRGPGLWERLLILDEDPGWSLLPAIKIGRRTAVACQLVWAGIAVGSYLVRGVGDFHIAGIWMMGVICLYYIIARVRRVPASAGAATIDPDSHFLMRLCMDAVILLCFVSMLTEAVLGVRAVSLVAALLGR